MIKLKATFNMVRNYFKNYEKNWTDVFGIFMIIGALFFGITAFKESKPVNFTDEEIQNYSVIAETIWNDGLNALDYKDADYSISISLPSKITVSSNHYNQGNIMFDFSKNSLDTTINNKTIVDSIGDTIAFMLVGGLLGAIAFFIIVIVLWIILSIIKFIWNIFVKIHDSYNNELKKLEE